MLALVAGASAASASPITIFMQGEVSAISTPPGLVAPGQPVSATIVIIPGTEDLFPELPETGRYPNTVSEFTFSVGSLNGTAIAGGLNNYTLVYDGEYFSDSVAFRSQVHPGFIVERGRNAFIQFNLDSFDQTILSSDAFPTVQDLEAFQTATLRDVDANFLAWDGGRIDWDITSFTVVPEPSTALLVLTGLALSARRTRTTPRGHAAERRNSAQPEPSTHR